MKKNSLIFILLILLQACLIPSEVEKPLSNNTLVITQVIGLEDSLSSFFDSSYEIVSSFDESRSDLFTHILVLYNPALFNIIPPSVFGGTIRVNGVVVFENESGQFVTLAYLNNFSDYIELFTSIEVSQLGTPNSFSLYDVLPLEGTSLFLHKIDIRESRLKEIFGEDTNIIRNSFESRKFYTSEIIVVFMNEEVPVFLEPYKDLIQYDDPFMTEVTNERGQKIIMIRINNDFVESYLDDVNLNLELNLIYERLLLPVPLTLMDYVSVDSANPDICKIQSPRNAINLGRNMQSTSVGHNIPTRRLASVGTQTGLVVRIEFDEYPPVISHESYLKSIQTAKESASKYFYNMSEGQLEFRWKYFPEVISAPYFFKPDTHAGQPDFMDSINNHIALVMSQVEKSVDLSEFDFISFYWPTGVPSYTPGGVAELLYDPLPTKRGEIYNYILQLLTTDFHRDNYVVRHEMAHMLGLTDTYIFPWIEEFSGLSTFYKYGTWDLMTADTEINAWNRWILSWIDDDQVYCIPSNLVGEFDVLIEPLNEVEADTRLIVIQLLNDQAISIELRGPGLYCTTGCNQNVLVTHIDSNTLNGIGPYTILRPKRSTDERHRDSLLLLNESVTYEKITITHIERGPQGSIIRINMKK